MEITQIMPKEFTIKIPNEFIKKINELIRKKKEPEPYPYTHPIRDVPDYSKVKRGK